MNAQAMSVWVAYATEQQQFHIQVDYVENMTAWDAIQKSGLAQQVELPENLQIGIFGIKLESVNTKLEVGDRVEIYRALTINPKDIRRKRAQNNPVGRYCRGNRFKQSSS